MEKIKPYTKYIIGLIVLVFIVISQLMSGGEEVLLPPELPTNSEVEVEYIYIDLKGQVRYPGVYKVLKETRLFQVVQQAGGLTVYADDLAINLSMKLYDQTVVYIPHVDEEFPSVHDDGGGIHNGVVNINQASLEELMTLPGIGEVTANDIISYRNEHGGFSEIEELMNVPGIGEATFEKLKEDISVS